MFGVAVLGLGLSASYAGEAAEALGLRPLDVFELEYAVDPRISPDGKRVAYVRRSLDIMTDRALSNVWTVDRDGSNHRPVLSGTASYSQPRWSPDGDRLLYVAQAGDRGAELHLRWMDTGQTALLTNLPYSPEAITWAPDGRSIAFVMFVAGEGSSLGSMPSSPEGAAWAPALKVYETMPFRADGEGYLDPGYYHLFVVSAEGGTPRQLTEGDYDHYGRLSWSPDGTQIVFTAHRVEDAHLDQRESEVWSVEVASGELSQLTDRDGPDRGAQFSADGRQLVYLGFDDQGLSYANQDVYLLDLATQQTRCLTEGFDRSVTQVEWGPRGTLTIAYDDHGKRRLARLSLQGERAELVDDVGGTSRGRPYTGGAFSVSRKGAIAYTQGTVASPAEVGWIGRDGTPTTLTRLNADLLDQRSLASVETLRWTSSEGDLEIEGWLMKPPDFDANKKYPLILEIHGGPFAAYGPQFSPELQLYASEGYLVLYTNPRGSTSYGAAFANEIHQAYPGRDYADLMSGVDAVVERGYVDPDQLFVTGGSGGGVLSAWIVGKTDRFRAAAVQKPVINWTSFALTSDGTAFYTKYWFATPPWEDPNAYWSRSPLSLVGAVSTPTLLITGEQDFRTPIGESEQFYQALKLRGVDTALVRVPESSHYLVARPSYLIAKVNTILAWFGRYGASEE